MPTTNSLVQIADVPIVSEFAENDDPNIENFSNSQQLFLLEDFLV